jgi:hypothetical protein
LCSTVNHYPKLITASSALVFLRQFTGSAPSEDVESPKNESKHREFVANTSVRLQFTQLT